MDKPLQVLMLEDEPADAELAERELRKAGIVFLARRVVTRDDFVAALDAFRPDVILADYRLPGFDGLAALGIAREKVPDVPFIFVSGAMGEGFAIETLHQGAADYVLKGHLSKLVPAINRALQDAEERRRRKAAEESLRESEERWKFALEGAGDGVWDWNVQTGEVNFSRRWKEMLGYAEDEIGNSIGEWEKLVHPEDKSRALACIQAYFDGARPDYVIEHRLSCKDGSWKWILARGMVVSRTADGKPLRMIGTHADITERKRVQEELQSYQQDLEGMVVERTDQLRSLTTELAMAEERERHAIAQDLHDDLGQILAIVKLRLTSLEMSGKDEWPRNLMQQVKEIEAMVDRANHSVRSLSMQLSPPVLSQYGLVPALEWLSEEMQRAYGLNVRIHSDGKPKLLNETQSSSLFRTVRELLINVSKHAQAGVAEVSVLTDGDKLVITVADAGIGFDVIRRVKPSTEGGYGLFSVRERITAIGGEMQIDSRPGDGTVAVLTLPLGAMDDQAPEVDRVGG